VVYGWLHELFGEVCPACGGPTPAGFCAVCAASFASVRDPCRRCGLGKPVAHCPARAPEWRVAAVTAPLMYSPPLDHYVHALKYHGARALARSLALLIVAALRSQAADVDALVPVPLHRARLYSRGYNQAAELARALGRELGLPTLERGIGRRAAASSQTAQGAVARRASVAQAFGVRRNLAGRRIAIVDDVLTTGATANSLATALLAAGAERCVVWAVARTPERATQPPNV
jgi:ComF family protein